MGQAYPQMIRGAERAMLQSTDGNQMRAAEILDANRNTLRRKMGAYGIEPRWSAGAPAGPMTV